MEELILNITMFIFLEMLYLYVLNEIPEKSKEDKFKLTVISIIWFFTILISYIIIGGKVIYGWF